MTPTIMVFGLDDDREDIQLLKAAFLKNGIVDFEFFENPKEFLSVFTEDIHVAVVDFYLGNTTGYDILKEIRKKNKKCLVTMISGDLNKKTLIKLYNSGASKYVEKEDGWETEVAEHVKEHIAEVQERLQMKSDIKDIWKNA